MPGTSRLTISKANPEDAAAIMAKGLGSFYETAADIDADLAGVTLFDQPMNEAFLHLARTAHQQGYRHDGLRARHLYQLGMITNPCTPGPADRLHRMSCRKAWP